MHFTLQNNHLLYFLCIWISRTIASPVKDLLQQNDGPEGIQFLNQQLESSIVSTTTQFSSTTDSFINHRPNGLNLKVIAILVGSLVCGLSLIRLCLVLYNSSRSSNNASTNRRTSIVRPQIAIVELNRFKPDLPPDYAEAIANINIDEGKLPSYAELRQTNA